MNPEDEAMAHHLLVVTAQGLLKRLQTPFRALVVVQIEELEHNKVYLVSAVITDDNEMMRYLIKGQGYCYYYFLIVG